MIASSTPIYILHLLCTQRDDVHQRSPIERIVKTRLYGHAHNNTFTSSLYRYHVSRCTTIISHLWRKISAIHTSYAGKYDVRPREAHSASLPMNTSYVALKITLMSGCPPPVAPRFDFREISRRYQRLYHALLLAAISSSNVVMPLIYFLTPPRARPALLLKRLRRRPFRRRWVGLLASAPSAGYLRGTNFKCRFRRCREKVITSRNIFRH